MDADTLSGQINDCLARMKDAWDRGDATAYAECFSPDAVYVIFVGTTYIGRRDITECHEALFAKFAKGTTMFLTVLDMRFHGPDTATVLTSGDAAKRAPRPGRGKVQTYTFHRGTDGWTCVSFQNTKRNVLMERTSFLFDRRFRPILQRAI
ncbi:SgcJ/EcaC family oxidoreductase [Actinoplanes friuliensis]|nr:SgcJ/EcaC family oxidoreductase [Actinoplanes friuliensis]